MLQLLKLILFAADQKFLSNMSNHSIFNNMALKTLQIIIIKIIYSEFKAVWQTYEAEYFNQLYPSSIIFNAKERRLIFNILRILIFHHFRFFFIAFLFFSDDDEEGKKSSLVKWNLLVE